MKFEIVGSGGCVSLPKPLCNCSVCNEAREKGRPYSRFGCSLFLYDLNLLIDTPEDIVHAINHSSIKSVEKVMFSHMDPDHTLGFRLFEQLRLNWFDVFEGKECNNPIDVIATDYVMDDLNAIKSVYGGYLDYYENVRKLITRISVNDSIILNDIKVSFIRVDRATVFVFEVDYKKLIYAPCDIKPFPRDDIFMNADILIIGNTFIGDRLKDDYVLSLDNPLRTSLFSMEEIVALKSNYNIKRVIMTHIEEDWGKSYDDYLRLEEMYDNIQFAYDGMMIEL